MGNSEMGFLSCFFWIFEGDLNKRHDGISVPIQSFLFCIKATSNHNVVETSCCGSFERLWSFIR